MTAKKKKPVKPSVQMPATVAALKRELAESDNLRDRMSLTLRNTADALHGGPLEDGYWSWHDLPELAKSRLDEVSQLHHDLRISEDSRLALLLYIRTNPDPIRAKAGTAYADMVETCHKSGLTPLTPEQFAAEDARMLVQWNNRRNGLDPQGPTTSITRGPKVAPGAYGQCWPEKADLHFVRMTLLKRLKRLFGVKEWWK